MKECIYYEKSKDGSVRCNLCPHQCRIEENQTGICGIRKNENKKLYSLVYGKPSSVQVDPVEKKPLYHFMPGTMAYSVGTIGCNFKCLHCLNWNISIMRPEDTEYGELEQVSPKKIVEAALQNNCKSIAFTYNEPTIFIEYMIDIAKEAKKSGLKTSIVSNGFISKEPLLELSKHIDAANIDLKAFDNNFYKKICKARLEPVLESLKIIKKLGMHLEITNLVIPTLNDDFLKIRKMVEWIIKNIGRDVPLHFSAFHPCYKLDHLPATDPLVVEKARTLAMEMGMHYVYCGNIFTEKGGNTYCPECGKLLISRSGFSIVSDNLVNSDVLTDAECSCGFKLNCFL